MSQNKKHFSEKSILENLQETTGKAADVESLRVSEAKFRGFIENLSVMFYAAEPRPPYAAIYISPAFAQLGYRLEEWRETSDFWTRVLHADDREWVLEKTEAAMRAGEGTDFEYRIVARDGTVRWVRDRGSFTRDAEGNAICWQGIILDITSRKLDEKNLQRSEKLYRTLAQSIPQTAVVLFDRDFRYTLADGALLEKNGFSREMFEGKTLYEIFPPEICEEWADYYRRALGGETVSFEQESEQGSFQIYVVPVRNEAGNIFAGMVMWQDISERKQAGAALKASEQRYRQMFERNQAIKLLIDADTGAIMDTNPAARDFYGYTSETFKTKNITDLNILPAEQVLGELRRAKTEEHNYFQFCHRLASGEIRDVEIHSSPLQDQNRNLLYSIIQDVTERKQTERALKLSEERYRDLFENANDLIYIHDLEGNYISVNHTAVRVLGYSYEEAIKMNMTQIVVPEHHHLARRSLFEKLAGAKQQSSYEVDCLTKDGRRITLEINSRAIFEGGAATAVQGIARDITDRKQAEAALTESEERYRDLYENANDLIYTHDLQGNFTSLNRAGESITGYSRAEALQMNIAQVIAPDYLKAASRMISTKIAEQSATTYESEIVAKQGHRVSLELSSRVIYHNEKPIGVQAIGRDITGRKRAENFLQISEAKLKDLFDNAPVGYHELDKEGRIVRVNRTESEMLGYTQAEMLGRFVWDFVVESVSRSAILGKLSGSVPSEPHERNFRRKDGSTIPFLIEEKIIKDENGAITGIRSTVQNITERKQAEKALINSERRYRLLGEGIMHQVWTAEPGGKLDYVNERTLAYFGRAFEQVINEGWQNVVHPDDLSECVRRWNYSLETGEDYEVEFRLRRFDGDYRWHQARATAGHDADGKVINWFGTNTDIQDRKIAEAKLNYIAGHDTLTNLPNRARFMSHLVRAVNRAEHHPSFRFAVLFLDLDRFKVINDSLGHTTGDKLLVALAKRLEECMRPNDIVARLGGDEFTVLLYDINEPADAVRVANRLLEKLSVPFTLDDYEVFTSASIGILVSDEVRRQPEDFLRDADTAMYRAKEAGKSRYEIFDREMHIRNMNLLQLENDLRRAIKQNEFRVFYQPIVKLETGEIHEFEALIRWQHPQHGLILPNEFINIAEETGLIIPIGRWILEEACRQTAEWQKQFSLHKNLSISVNLSAKQLMHPNLTAQVSESLEKTALASSSLKLEVTESMVMENSDKAFAVISELNNLGISLSTDDFGTGYSSLSYLHRFPFNCLKIDRSFVSKMDSDQKSEAIVRTILLLAQNLNIEVIAEGIETESQLNSLRQLGCQTGQGYLFSKPVAAETAAELLQNGLPNENAAPFYGFGETENQQYLELDKVQ